MRSFLKKVIGFGIVLSVLTMSAFAAYVDMPADAVEKAALERAVENGLIKGVSDTEIAPYMTITRAQLGAIVVRAMGATREANIANFKDVSKTAWYYKEMRRAVEMGAFKGNDKRELLPNQEITKQEAFLVLSRVFDLRYENDNSFSKYPDSDKVAKWAKSGVSKIISGGYYDGKELNPTGPITRVEFAKVMDKLVTTYINTPGTYKNLPKGNTLVRCDGVIFDGVTFDNSDTVTGGDIIIIGDGVKNSQFVNIKGVNAAIRGGNAVVTGEIGLIRTAAYGASITPILEKIQLKNYADGTRGVLQALVEGSYILMEQGI